MQAAKGGRESTSATQKTNTYIRGNLELLKQQGRIGYFFLVFAEQILVEHGLDISIARALELFLAILCLSERLEDLQCGALAATRQLLAALGR